MFGVLLDLYLHNYYYVHIMLVKLDGDVDNGNLVLFCLRSKDAINKLLE